MAKPRNKENAELHSIMDEEELTRPEVAQITGTTKACVDQWLRPPGSAHYRPMKERYLRLLKFELGRQQPKHTRFHRGIKSR